MRISNDELGKQAYKRVKQMIVSKKLVPGQKIVQEQLAAQLGISRTPLRDALQMLEAESLVESIPRRGVVVRKFSNEEILEIYDCRIALEGAAIRLFVKEASDAAVGSLRELIMPFKVDRPINENAYQKADSKFHDTIIKNCGNRFLYNLFQKGNLLTCIDSIGLVRAPEETLQEHMAIIEAIERRDVSAAVEGIQEHLEKSKRLILKNVKDGN